MTRTPRHSLIKELQTKLPRGSPFDIAELNDLGISAQLAARYAKSGWLERLGHGIYAFAGDKVTAHGAAKLLQRQVKGLHVAGKSALGLQGVRHNLATHETLVLWGEARFSIPRWLTARYPVRYVWARLFEWPEGQELDGETIITPPGVTDGLRVSTPERAALEMLYEVGTHEGVEETRNVFEGLRNLRRNVTGKLLAHCTSVKAVRLFLTWARETNLLDVDALREQYDLRVGSRERRWMSRLKDGTLLSLKPYG